MLDPGRLGKLAHSLSDGTNVNLTVLRKGKEVKVTVKMVKKERGRGAFRFGREWKWDDLGKMNFDMPDMATVREAVARAREEALRAGDEARRAVQRLRVVTTDDGLPKTTNVDLGKATITFSNEEGESTMARAAVCKMLTATVAHGTVLFIGTVDNDA